MADVTLTYKGSDILELSDSGSATLKTGGKYCEDDIALEYVKPSGGGSQSWELINTYTLAEAWNTANGLTSGTFGALRVLLLQNVGNGFYKIQARNYPTTQKYIISGVWSIDDADELPFHDYCLSERVGAVQAVLRIGSGSGTDGNRDGFADAGTVFDVYRWE